MGFDEEINAVFARFGQLLNGTTREMFVEFIDENREIFTMSGDNLWSVYKQLNLREENGIWKLREN